MGLSCWDPVEYPLCGGRRGDHLSGISAQSCGLLTDISEIQILQQTIQVQKCILSIRWLIQQLCEQTVGLVMALDNNLVQGEVVPRGSDLGFHTMLCCICLGLATYCHQRCMWSCRTVTYRERRPCILDARLEFSSWFYIAISFAHVLVSLCHQQGMDPPWCPGVGPPWTWL